MTVTNDPRAGAETAGADASPRLEEFRQEVSELKVTGGAANPERLGMIAGVVLFVAAVILEIVAYSSSSSASDVRDQNDMIILALFGVVLALGAVALFVRYALTRWFRYWLVRLVFEDRQQTDRIVEALKDR
jgi:ABC-type Fe3+ transport system permease subunit